MASNATAIKQEGKLQKPRPKKTGTKILGHRFRGSRPEQNSESSGGPQKGEVAGDETRELVPRNSDPPADTVRDPETTVEDRETRPPVPPKNPERRISMSK